MNTKYLLSVTAAALLSLAPNVVQAQVPLDGQRDPISLYVEAGASKEQQAKIRELAREFETGAKVKTERAGNLLRKMQQFSLEPMPDERAVLATQTEINLLLAEIANARIKLMLSIRGVLSDEQRVKLVGLLKESKQEKQAGM